MKKCLSSIIAVVVTAFSTLSISPVALVAADVDISLEISTNGSSWIGISASPQSVPGPVAYVRPVIVPTVGGSPIAGQPVKVDMPATGGEVDVSLTSSTDLSVWANEPPGTIALADKKFFRAETIAFSFIPAGSFTMGSPLTELGREPGGAPETQHEVTLTRSFYMQQTEVTYAQWNEVRDWALANGYSGIQLGANGMNGDASGNHPVTEVQWYGVLKWLNARSQRDGLTPCYTTDGVTVYKSGITVPVCDFSANGYRLPTEAEWEYACRAGSTTAFYNGDITQTGSSPVDPNLDLIGWYAGNGGGVTHPVASKQPNAWELYDMSGNVFEWCWDWYDGDLGSGSVVDPTGAASSFNSTRVYRGGSWQIISEGARSAFRSANVPDQSSGYFNTVGFRPVRTAGGGS